MRLSPEHKKLIERAASLKGQSLSAWIKFVLLSKAEEVLETHDRTVLSLRDWQAFYRIADAVDAPAPALKKAVKRYGKRRVVD
jgi:uncharacterized protein (DUF1778 family)